MSERLPPTRVLLVRGERTSLRVALPPFGALTVGQSTDCDVTIREPGVLERHAVLHLDFGAELELTSNASIAIRSGDANQSFEGPASVEIEPGTRVTIGGAELRLAVPDEGVGERRILAPSLLPDDTATLTLDVHGAVEESEAADVFFSVLSDGDAVHDLGDGRYTVLLGEARPDVGALLTTRFKAAGFDTSILGADGETPKLRIEDTSTEPLGPLRDELAALEKRRMIQALEQFGNQQEAAAALDIPIRTFVNRMDALGIPRRRSGKKKR